MSQIEDVRFHQNLSQRAGEPEVAARRCFDAVCRQPFADLVVAFALKELPVDSLHHFRLFRVDHKVSVFVLVVAEEPVRANLHLSLLVAVLDAKPDVLGKALAFLLYSAQPDGKVTDLIRTKDPTRLVEEASGWFDQGGGDLYSIHNYFRKLRIRPKPHRCIALTEFGGYSWHIPGRSMSGQEYGYRKYHSREDLTRGMEALWDRDLFRTIPKGLSASVYTQVSDIEDETNGLMTYDREEIKVDQERLRQINKKLRDIFEASAG